MMPIEIGFMSGSKYFDWPVQCGDMLEVGSAVNLTLGARANGGDDFITISDPDEWLWVFVVLSEEAVDGGLKVDE